jgi:hypothetical protein
MSALRRRSTAAAAALATFLCRTQMIVWELPTRLPPPLVVAVVAVVVKSRASAGRRRVLQQAGEGGRGRDQRRLKTQVLQVLSMIEMRCVPRVQR